MNFVYLAPHNDDEVLWGTFLLLRHRPHVVVCLRSARMEQPDYPFPEFAMSAATREHETDQAMGVVGCEWEQWPELDTAPDWDSIADGIAEMSGRFGHCFAPAFEEGGHAHHNRVAEIAVQCFGRKNVTGYLTYTYRGRSTWGAELQPVGGWPDVKAEALACYASQAAHPMTSPWFQTDDLREFVAA